MRNSRIGALLVLFAAAVVLGGPALIGAAWQTALINVLFYTYLCVSWNVIAGIGGQMSLGHPVFLAAGAYTSSILLLHYRISPWIGMVAGTSVAGIMAVLIGYVSFRYRIRGLYFALLTFALLVIAASVIADVRALGGTPGLMLPLGDSFLHFVWRSRLPYYYVMLTFLVGAIFVSRLVITRRLGWQLVAAGRDEEVASALGIDVAKVKLQALVISAVLTALAGTFYAQFYQLVSPDTVLTLDPQIKMLVGTIVGGIGTLWGPVVGGLMVGAISQLLLALPINSVAAASLGEIVFAVLLIGIAVYMPHGVVRARSKLSGAQWSR